MLGNKGTNNKKNFREDELNTILFQGTSFSPKYSVEQQTNEFFNKLDSNTQNLQYHPQHETPENSNLVFTESQIKKEYGPSQKTYQQLSKKERQNMGLNESIQKSLNQLKNRNQMLSQNKSDKLQQLLDEYKMLQTQNVRLHDLNDDYMKQIAVRDQKIRTSQHQINSLQNKIQEYKENQKDYIDNQFKFEQLAKQVSTSQKQDLKIRKQQKEIQRLQASNDIIKNRNDYNLKNAGKSVDVEKIQMRKDIKEVLLKLAETEQELKEQKKINRQIFQKSNNGDFLELENNVDKKELQRLRTENKELHTLIELIKVEQSQRQKSRQIDQQSISSDDRNMRVILNQNKILTKELETKENQIDQLTLKLKQLQQKKQSPSDNAEVKTLMQELKIRDTQIDLQRKDFQKFRKHEKELQNRIIELQKQCKDFLVEIQRLEILKDKNSSPAMMMSKYAQQQQERIVNLEEKLKTQTQIKNDLKKHLSQIQTKLNEKQDQYDCELRSIKDSVSNNMQLEIQKFNDDYKLKEIKLRDENITLVNKCEFLKLQIKELVQQKMQIIQKHVEKERVFDRVQIKCKKMENENKYLQELEQNLKKVRNQKLRLEIDVKDKQREIIELKDQYQRIIGKSNQVEKLERRIQQSSQKASRQSLKIAEKNTNLEELKNEVRLLTIDKNDLKKQNNSIKSLEKNISKLQKLNENYKTTNEDLKQKNIHLEKMFVRQTTEQKQLNRELQNKNNKIKTLTKQLAKSDKKHKTIMYQQKKTLRKQQEDEKNSITKKLRKCLIEEEEKRLKLEKEYQEMEERYEEDLQHQAKEIKFVLEQNKMLLSKQDSKNQIIVGLQRQNQNEHQTDRIAQSEIFGSEVQIIEERCEQLKTLEDAEITQLKKDNEELSRAVKNCMKNYCEVEKEKDDCLDAHKKLLDENLYMQNQSRVFKSQIGDLIKQIEKKSQIIRFKESKLTCTIEDKNRILNELNKAAQNFLELNSKVNQLVEENEAFRLELSANKESQKKIKDYIEEINTLRCLTQQQKAQFIKMNSNFRKNKLLQDQEFQEMRNAMKSNYEVQIVTFHCIFYHSYQDQLENKYKKLKIENEEITDLISDKDMSNIQEVRTLRTTVTELKNRMTSYENQEVLINKSVNTVTNKTKSKRKRSGSRNKLSSFKKSC